MAAVFLVWTCTPFFGLSTIKEQGLIISACATRACPPRAQSGATIMTPILFMLIVVSILRADAKPVLPIVTGAKPLQPGASDTEPLHPTGIVNESLQSSNEAQIDPTTSEREKMEHDKMEHDRMLHEKMEHDKIEHHNMERLWGSGGTEFVKLEYGKPSSTVPAGTVLADDIGRTNSGCLDSATSVCRLPSSHLDPATAYMQCFSETAFGNETARASLVRASELMAGDWVLDGARSATRVVVNGHRTGRLSSQMVTLTTEIGSLKLTLDHALYAEGMLTAAADVSVGSKLQGADGRPLAVTAVTASFGILVNPFTASGHILADGHVVTTYLMGIAEHFVNSSSFPFPICERVSLVAPAFSQVAYDLYEPFLEPLVSSYVVPLAMATPAPVLAAFFFAVEAGIALLLLALGCRAFVHHAAPKAKRA